MYMSLNKEKLISKKTSANQDLKSSSVQKVASEKSKVSDFLKPNQTNMFQYFANDNNKPIQKKQNNTGLPDNIKSGVESLSGISLDDVKVHYNSAKPAQLQALAYTQGTDIHVANGQEKHLPHEAWHVVQQKQGRVKPTIQIGGININDNADLEHEADTMGKKAIQCKTINNAIQFKYPKCTCVQRVIPTAADLNAESGDGDKDTPFIFNVNENGVTVLPDYIISGTPAKTAKELALNGIAIRAGSIGNSLSLENNECIRAKITSKYKTRKDQNVKISLTYHFGNKKFDGSASGNGYVVNVEKENETTNKSHKGEMVEIAKIDGVLDSNYKVDSTNVNHYSPVNKTSEYTNKHHDNFGLSILDETYKKGKDNSGADRTDADIESKHYDAYTKIAGEGARFQCVRENMGILREDSYFCSGTQGIKFSDLWGLWNDCFYSEYNIPNQAIIEFIITNDFNDINDFNKLNATKEMDSFYYVTLPVVNKKYYFVDKSGNKTDDPAKVNKNNRPKLFLKQDGCSYKWKIRSKNKRNTNVKTPNANDHKIMLN